MRNEQNAVLASLRRAQQFLDTNGDLLSTVNTSTRKQLDDVVTQLSNLSIAQDGGDRGSKGETARQRVLLLSLRRNYMAPIAVLARLKLRDVPEFACLTLPSANATPQRAVSAAYAMADAATPYAQTFIDNGLPATFADDLRAAAAGVLDSIDGRSKHQSRRTGATAGLAAEEKRGRTMLRVLDALIMAHVGTDDQVIAEWNSAKMVRRKPGPAAGSQSSNAAPADAVATPTGPTLVTSSGPTSTSTQTPTPVPLATASPAVASTPVATPATPAASVAA